MLRIFQGSSKYTPLMHEYIIWVYCERDPEKEKEEQTEPSGMHLPPSAGKNGSLLSYSPSRICSRAQDLFLLCWERGNLWAAVHLLLVPQAWEQPLLSIYEVRLKRRGINRKVITVEKILRLM